MITGDARETALAISNQLGLLAKKALSGKEIDELGELELPTAVSESSGKVFKFFFYTNEFYKKFYFRANYLISNFSHVGSKNRTLLERTD